MAALCKRVWQSLLAKVYMCVSVSVSEWRGSGPPSGNSDKGFSKRERDYIYHSRTDRKRNRYKDKKKENGRGKERKKETETHPERNNVKWTKCVIVTVGKRLLMSCQTSDCAVNLSVNL